MGIGGSAAAGNVGAKSYVTGQLQLNAPALVRMAVALGNTDRASGVIKHELGHLVGLGHVQDTGELMNAESTAEASTYQDGDLAGLAVLGQGKCRPEL